MTGEDNEFAAHRGLLFTVAYELLGSTADAEDVLQDSWLRWAGVDHAQVRDPRSYLVSSGSSAARPSTGCGRWRGGARTTSASGCRNQC